MAKKKIEVTYYRKVQFHNIIEVTDKEFKRALALDGEDLTEPRSFSSDEECDWTFVTEELTDVTNILDRDEEIESLSIAEYKTK